MKAVKYVLVGNCELAEDTKSYFHESVTRIVGYNPLIGNLSIDVPEIGATAGKPAADSVLGHAVAATANAFLNASDTSVCGIQENEEDGNAKVGSLRPGQEVSQRST